MTDFDDLLAKLEPAATKGESEWPNVAQFSMAVSLKRIADALTCSHGDTLADWVAAGVVDQREGRPRR